MRYLLSLLVMGVLVGSAVGQTCVPSTTQTCTSHIGLALPNQNSPAWGVPLNQNSNWLDSLMSGASTGTSVAFANLSSLDNIIFVDGVKYANIAAAVTGAGTSQTLIVIPSSYAGTECPAATSAKISFFDLRGGSNICVQNSVSYNTLSGGGLFSLLRGVSTSTGGFSVAGYFQNFVTNATGGASTNADGGSLEADVTGTLSGTFVNVQAAENPVIVASTGGTVSNAVGQVGYVNTNGGSTTNIITVKGTWGLGCNSILGSGTITNCYGTYSDEQVSGSTRNYALAGFGKNLLGYGGNFGGSALDAEDSSHVAHRFLVIDSSSNTIVQAIGTNGLFLKDSTGTPQQTITSSGTKFANSVGFANLLNSATAPTISSGFGTSPSIVNSNGTAVFEVNVGTGGVATSGVLTMPTANVGWSCQVTDMNTNDVTRETAFTTTSITLTAASAWTASDKLLINCGAF